MHEEFCIVSDFPEILKVDEQNRPHNDEGPSHRWSDGFEIYFLHGVRFDKELYQKVTSRKMPFQDILSISDVDQRTQALRFVGEAEMDKFIEHVKGKLLDEVNKYDINNNPINYKLYKFPSGDIFEKDAYYCKFECPSTSKKHIEGVEEFKTVAEAMAWSMSAPELGITITADEWKELVPLRDEN